MKRIVLVRHATAVEVGPKGSDFHRRLKKRGRREAAIMADRTALALGPPDVLMTSPAERALETARAFAERLGIAAERLEVREALYGGLLPEEFLHVVKDFDDAHQSVMVFGHDPSFSEFAAFLIPGFSHLIPKAGVVAIDLDRKSWRAVRPGDGVLVAFEQPPAPDVQKRIEGDLLERLASGVRGAVWAVLREFTVPENREVVRAVARASARIAQTARPFATAKAAPKPGARGAGTAVVSKRRAQRVVKGPRRSRGGTASKRRTRSGA